MVSTGSMTGVGRRWMSLGKKTGWWTYVPQAPPDAVLGVTEAFLKDTHPNKVNLGVGAYRDDSGNPVVLECVRRAERIVSGNGFMEYLPMGGSVKFTDLALKLAYGDDADVLKEKRVAAVQTLSGTGACRLMAEYQKKFEGKVYMYIPYPTWPNHHNIWKDAQVRSQTYRYYDADTKGLNFTGLVADAKQAQDGSFFLLHACAHNPTGVDPTAEQWRELSELFKEKRHFAFFDMSYQGFATGDFEKDAQPIRIFVQDGHEIGLAQSFAKNMGLYGHRIGCLSLVTEGEKQALAVKTQLQQILRPMYSSPPLHGAELVTTVLSDPELKALWFQEVKGMADRIIGMRAALREHLEQSGSTLSWKHVTDQIGMFCYSGLTQKQVERLTKEHHVYLTKNGRISMAGVNSGNVEYLAKAIHEVATYVEVLPEPELDAHGRPVQPTIQPPARRKIKWNGGDWRRS
ncbi:unnamed protein product [Calypogeia fissa]